MIEFSSFTERYGRYTAVDGLSFGVPVGGLFGLLGSNGAGKPTTIQALMGLTRPSSGQVRGAATTSEKNPLPPGRPSDTSPTGRTCTAS